MATDPDRDAAAATPGRVPTIKWDDSDMRTFYANVCNVASTREEIVLLFGMHQAWRAGQKEVTVRLTDRAILSPVGAKRLAVLLANVIREYESRFGAIRVESRGSSAPS